ncbi:MAG TPA: virulence RhuM family protein [Bryobacteraceae bacterium]|jgi:hypothetical protein|nr:virulence RhuM family protein [Bryobacteraceae bacterium]
MEGNEKEKVGENLKSGRVRSGVARMQKLSPSERSELGKSAAVKRWSSMRNQPVSLTNSEVLFYQTEDGQTRIDVRLEDGTVWLSQAQMAELFQTTKQNISLHVKNVFTEQELDAGATVKDSLTVQQEGGRDVKRSIDIYNLDVIISVGYRVKSHRGTQFRMWATQRLREYIIKGFSLDDERLKNAGTRNDYFEELIQRVREIRTSEKNFYRKVTSIYTTSIDYDPNSAITQKFFATVQNKFHYAITGHTAAELIAERADADKPNMGLTHWEGERVRKADVCTAKNYLQPEEIEKLNLLVDQYLSFAELQAKDRRQMHMADWVKKLDAFLTLNERDILTHAGSISKKISDEIAAQEYDKFHMKQKAIDKDADVSDFDRFVRKIEIERSKN